MQFRSLRLDAPPVFGRSYVLQGVNRVAPPVVFGPLGDATRQRMLALAAYLTKAGAQQRLPVFYGGAALAVVASLVAAALFEAFNNGVHNDILEGVTIVLAAALMVTSLWGAYRSA